MVRREGEFKGREEPKEEIGAKVLQNDDISQDELNVLERLF